MGVVDGNVQTASRWPVALMKQLGNWSLAGIGETTAMAIAAASASNSRQGRA